MSLLIIRHGQDLPHYRGGWSSNGLTEEGRKQAHKLGKLLLSYNVSRIVTSDLPRARETADIINEYLRSTIEYCQAWREINSGQLSGMSKAQSDKEYPGFYIEKIDADQHFPGGESPREFYKRIIDAFEDLVNSAASNENIALVTHGGVVMALFHFLEGLDWINKRQYIKVEKCSISIAVLEDNHWKLCVKNYYSY